MGGGAHRRTPAVSPPQRLITPQEVKGTPGPSGDGDLGLAEWDEREEADDGEDRVGEEVAAEVREDAP